MLYDSKAYCRFMAMTTVCLLVSRKTDIRLDYRSRDQKEGSEIDLCTFTSTLTIDFCQIYQGHFWGKDNLFNKWHLNN